MRDHVLVGRQDQMHNVPAEQWLEHLQHADHHPSERLAFMTPDHHRVRNFAVTELPRSDGRPLSAEDIAGRLQLPLPTTRTILRDLEQHLFFLVLNGSGDVTWAYPVTVEKTAHRLRFSTGEQTFAA